MPEDAAPATWPRPYTQTVLKADKSPLVAVEWLPQGPPVFYPSAPMWHIGLVVGDHLIIEDHGMYDFTGAVVAYENAQIEAVVLSKWDEARLAILTICRFIFDVELPPELSIPFDVVFDELGNIVSPSWKYPLP